MCWILRADGEMRCFLLQITDKYASDARDAEIAALHEEVTRQRALADQAARAAGLPGRQTLEELYDLRHEVGNQT